MKRSKGFSLIEIMLVLALSIIMLTSMFLIYNTIEENKKINIVVSQINQIRAGSDFVYRMEKSYQSLNNSLLIKSDVIPTDMISEGNIINPYGGNIIVGSSPGSGHTRFNIQYQHVPSSACIKISAIINPTLFIIAIGNGNDLKNEGTIQFSLDRAIQFCDINNTGYVNMVFQSFG